MLLHIRFLVVDAPRVLRKAAGKMRAQYHVDISAAEKGDQAPNLCAQAVDVVASKLCGDHSSASRLRDEIHRMIMLMQRAIATYDKQFGEVDAQTSEVIGALKAVERQIQYIRQARDHLHLVLRDWDPLLKRWAEIPVQRARPMDQLLTDTYRLLAARFASATSQLKR